jgi:uncharacterized protein YkwD
VAINPVDRKTRELKLSSSELTLGSEPGNSLLLRDRSVSRRHAVIRYGDSKYLVLDLNSTNGTFVNEQPIRAPTVLRDGDHVRFGGAQYVFLDPRPKPVKGRRSFASIIKLCGILFAVAFGLTEYVINRQFVGELVQRLSHANQRETAIAPKSPAPAATSVSHLENGGIASVPESGPTPARALKAAPVRLATPRPSARSAQLGSVPPNATGTTVNKASRPGVNWLERFNSYRMSAGLSPVAEDAGLSDGCLKHARYLVKNQVPPNGSAHDEDPTNRWFTPEGRVAARTSDVVTPCSGCVPMSAPQAIDLWMTGPFHRVSILDPELRRVGYGEYDENGLKAHAVSVSAAPPNTRPLSPPIMFPANGAVVSLRTFQLEWPNPLASCPGYASPSGLPITLQLGWDSSPKIYVHSLRRAGRDLEHCVFSSDSYSNADPVAERWGREILQASGAIVLIPRAPLEPGNPYEVRISFAGKEYSWSFSVSP